MIEIGVDNDFWGLVVGFGVQCQRDLGPGCLAMGEGDWHSVVVDTAVRCTHRKSVER